MVDDLKKEKGGFEFKKLEYEPIKTPELLNDKQDIKLADEKPVATLYGSPAPTQLKVTPLHKKGKLAINYAAKDYSAKLLGDLDKDGELSGYEANRQEAIEKNMEKEKKKKS